MGIRYREAGAKLTLGYPRNNIAVPGQGDLRSLITSTDAANLIAYWPLGDLTGTTADDPVGGFDGAYAGTFTLAQPGIGDGSTSVLFGDDARVTLAAVVAALDTPFDPALGTMLIAAKVLNAGVWTDGVARFSMAIGADTNNRVRFNKASASNNLTWAYIAGGTSDSNTQTISTINWFLMTVTWNVASDRARWYFNRTLNATNTTLGTWSGALATGGSAIGAQTGADTTANWAGWLAHAALWKSELTLAQIQRLAPAAYFPD